MAYIRIHEGVTTYPFKPDSLRGGPRHSFPLGEIPESILAEHGVFPVTPVAPPPPSPGVVVEEGEPIEVNGVWQQQWSSRPVNAGEIVAFRESRKNAVLKLLGEKIDAVALNTALDSDDLLIIEGMSKLAAGTMAYLLASNSAPFRSGVASCRARARSLISSLNGARTYAEVSSIDITTGWPV